MNNTEYSEIDNYEKSEKWIEAKDTLGKIWRSNPYDLNILIRYGFLSWYILVEWEDTKYANVDSNELLDILNEVCNFGIENFSENEKFLWVFGYMMSVFPEHFLCGYMEAFNKGKQMLEKAFQINPNNDIVRLIYFRSNNQDILTELMCENIKKYIDKEFSVECTISKYFKSMIAL